MPGSGRSLNSSDGVGSRKIFRHQRVTKIKVTQSSTLILYLRFSTHLGCQPQSVTVWVESMKKVSVAVLGLLLGMDFANAADMPDVVPVYAPSWSWTGFYVGAHLGAGSA